VLHGEGLDACEEALRRALPLVDDDEIRALVELPDGTDGRVRGLVRLGLAAQLWNPLRTNIRIHAVADQDGSASSR
jgi:hypothetical protein